MARGFESKDVEFQQEQAQRAKVTRRAPSPAEREESTRVRTLELALARTQADRMAATSAVHQQMLDRAIAALRADLSRPDGPS